MPNGSVSSDLLGVERWDGSNVPSIGRGLDVSEGERIAKLSWVMEVGVRRRSSGGELVTSDAGGERPPNLS